MFDKLVEQKIREAQEAGEFDNLEGAGRPVDLGAYFATPEESRAGYAVLKNAGVLPEEAEALREINDVRARLAAARDAAGRERLRGELERLRLGHALLVERRRARRPAR